MATFRRPSRQVTAVVLALAEQPAIWRYGYELCQRLDLEAGTLYPALMRLADRGLLGVRGAGRSPATPPVPADRSRPGAGRGPRDRPAARRRRLATQAEGQARRPRARSSSRRSRLVGRPALRSRGPSPARGPRGGGGGLWSIRHAAASVAPTRLPGSWATSTTRSRPPSRARTVSPTLTSAAGLARPPLICTCPARQACAARDRVFTSRTAHSQRSILVPSMPRW